MGFEYALKALKDGKGIKRRGWNGKDQYVILAHMESCILSNHQYITHPNHINIGNNFLMFVGTSGYQCGWLASQADMLAEDWEIIE